MSHAEPDAATRGDEIALRMDGAGVRVALIDSGVDATHPWLEKATITHVAVQCSGDVITVVPGRSGDASGHGTACAGIIHKLVPAARIIDVRVLDAQGRCSRAALMAALHHCVRARFEVVNLSLGIDLPKSAPVRATDLKSILDLYELADAAYTAGVVLVASGPNVPVCRTLPGRFKSLIGVGRGRFDDSEGLRVEVCDDYEIVAPGDDVIAPALGGGERRWTGTSFATPHVAAHVARIRAARPDLTIESVRETLHRVARRGRTHAT